MVDNTIRDNAAALNRELEWFYKVLETRVKLHFGHECEYSGINEILPPLFKEGSSIYGNFINHYAMNFSERVIFVLGLVPHIRPQLLDVFFTKNAENSRDFTEFGGRNSHSFPGFLPTGDTGLFLLAGNDMAQRFLYNNLFGVDHFFSRHGILTLENNNGVEPESNGFLTLSQEVIDLVTTGSLRQPKFTAEFPAKKIETELGWEDLVLDPHTMEQVLEIKAWIEYGDILLKELELGKKIKPGFRTLFYGPPGTGKTFTASLLGKITDREVYRVDLSMVISKYIGETEKNMEKIFQKAEHKNWILFFDEADALFGKRTSISNSHDRFANQEVSYLLQRVEGYAGVVILATNLKSNLDESFNRRFQSIIHFPMPAQGDRRRLWTKAFSDKITISKDVDFFSLAAEYELTGGAIVNVVRYAALMMLKNKEQAITLHNLREGIRKEFQKDGRTSSS